MRGGLSVGGVWIAGGGQDEVDVEGTFGAKEEEGGNGGESRGKGINRSGRIVVL